MKIALVVHDVGKQRGHDRYVVELATALSKRHDVHIFACTCEDIDRSVITFHRVPAFRWPDLLKMLSFLVTATWMLRKPDFDIIHTQGVCGFVQHVTTAHMCQAKWHSIYHRLDHSDVSPWRQRYHRLVMRIMICLERRLFQVDRIPRIIAVSRQVKTDLIRYYGRPADTITVIYNGLNIDEFHPGNIVRYRNAMRRDLGIADSTFVLLYVGEFKRKGLRHAIKALSYLPDPVSAVLIVVGEGDPAPYQQAAERLGVAKAVRFVGHQPDIARYYAMSDALVFPTLYEPFGFAITEAMATGIPVITSAAAGAAELIAHEENGLLLSDPGDVRAIASYIQRLITNVELRQRLSRNGRKSVEPLNWTGFAHHVENVYNTITG